jgi:uncharacterized protein YvpB
MIKMPSKSDVAFMLKELTANLPKGFGLKTAIVIAAMSVLSLAGGTIWYQHEPVQLRYSLSNVSVDAPLTVAFNVEVNPRINYNISPALPGRWEKVRGLLGVKELRFIPNRPLVPGSHHSIIIGGVSRVGSNTAVISQQEIPVSVESPAQIDSLTPAADATNVPINSQVVLKLKTANHDLRQFELTGDAGITFQPAEASSDKLTYTWKLKQPLAQGTTYHLSLRDLKQADPAKQLLLQQSFTAVPEPHVTGATDKDHFYPGDVITVSFDQAMKQTDTIFRWGFSGSGKWTSPTSYEYTPVTLPPGGSYSYSVVKGATSINGGTTESDHAYTIKPPGAAYVTGVTPGGTNNGLNAAVGVSFDQPVDHATAEAAFSIAPKVDGTFSWNGNTMRFTPKGYDYQTTYTVTEGAGVKATYGLPSTSVGVGRFTTVLQTIKLGVPLYHQQYTLSCEESALRMALAYRNINVNDFDVLNQVGYNPRPRDTGANSWDNPYEMFVGDINGVQGVTGWGVYSPRIAVAAHSLGRNAQAITGISASQISEAIHNGNPVVLWGYNGSVPKMDSWNTSSGVVSAPRNEHARTVIGVVGNVAAPSGFYLNDPVNGQIFWSTAQLNANMSYSGQQNSQAVIVY